MQWNVWAAPCIRGWRQIVGIGFAGHFQNSDGNALRHFGAAGKPLSIGPALQHSFGVRIAFVSLFFHIVKLVEHQQGFLQAIGGLAGHSCVVQQIDQRADVVTTQHGAEQFSCAFATDQRALFGAVRHCSQIAGFNLGGIVHTSGYAVRNQVYQCCFFTGRRGFKQLNQFGCLLGRQRQRGNAQGGTLGHMISVRLQHGVTPFFNNKTFN